MFPKAKRDNIQPFSGILMAPTLQKLRDDMAIWALNCAPACAELVLRPGELRLPECLDDRAADFMAPLYTIAGIARTDRTPLDEFCVKLAKLRHTDVGETVPAKVLAVLRDWFPQGEHTARIHLETLAGLLAKANLFCEADDAGTWLRRLGFEVKQLRIGSDNKKGVEISRTQLEDLLERYKVETAAER
jgi:hypothetical protein